MRFNSQQVKSLLVRFLISFVLLYFLSKKIEFSQFKELFLNIIPSFFILSFLILLVNQFLLTFALFWLLRAKEHEIAFKWLLWDFFMSNFLGSFIPSSLGVDAVRAYSISKRIKNPYDSISAMLVLRVVGMCLLLFLGLLSVLLFLKLLPPHICYSSVSVYVIFFLSLTVFISKRLRRLVAAFFDKLKLSFIRKKIEKVVNSIVDYKNYPAIMLKFLLISSLVQVNKIVFSFILAKALNIDCSLIIFFILIPLISLITAIPISIGGLGVREAGFVFLFGQVGKVSISSTTLIALSLSHFFMAVLFAFLGAFMFIIFPFISKNP